MTLLRHSLAAGCRLPGSIGLANQQTRSILAQSMQYFFDDYRIKADSLLASDSANDWQTVLNANNKLHKYHSESSPYLDHEFDEALTSVTDEAIIINENLFQYYFDKGQNALQQFENSGLKRYAQNAYYSFIKARNYNPPQPKEINALIRSAAAKGTVNYLIECCCGSRIFRIYHYFIPFSQVNVYVAK